jgi:mRNA-degrading endonuclease RelE of RelBE toxin-antitoxin system
MGKPLHLELKGQWSARRGPYRIIYSIDDSTDTITIIAIAHRADVYRRSRRG